jgi:tetratricopeptide (TPR) repeat protein
MKATFGNNFDTQPLRAAKTSASFCIAVHIAKRAVRPKSCSDLPSAFCKEDKIMVQIESKPALIRIAKLEDQLRQQDKQKSGSKFFADPSKVISIAAFIISIVTTVYSFRKDALETQVANRRQLDASIQQMIDVGIKTYELNSKNRNDPNYGGLSGWFNAQSGFLANKAAVSLDELKNASTIDFLLVGNALAGIGNYSKASQNFSRAIKINEQNRVDDESFVRRALRPIKSFLFNNQDEGGNNNVLRAHDLASAYVALGSSLYGERRLIDAEAQYKQAIQTIEKSDYPDEVKDYQTSFIHQRWAEATVQIDCRLTASHVQTAANVFPASKRFSDNPEWTFIQYQLAWITANCGPDGKVQGNWSTVQQSATGPTPGQPFPSVTPR